MLVEQELWQKEEKGLIGVLPVRDTETAAVGSMLSPGDFDLFSYPFSGKCGSRKKIMCRKFYVD